MQQINIVISGFTPYEGIDVNPAMLVPAAVAKQWADPAQSQAISEELLQDIAVTVTNVTLPVSFAKAWPTLLEAIEQAKPDIVIATGLKRTSRGILLERCATNLMDAAKPDADNVIPPRRPIDPEGPAAYWTRLPLRSILHDFAKHEIPAALSSDAGTFVCNSLFYHLLNWSAGQERRILSGVWRYVRDHVSKPHDSHVAENRAVESGAVLSQAECRLTRVAGSIVPIHAARHRPQRSAVRSTVHVRAADR